MSASPLSDGTRLLAWARRAAGELERRRAEINKLNVFPVPDSDTGTNLLYTMRAAVDRAEGEDAWIAEGGEREGRAPLQVVPEVPRKMVRFTLDVDAELHQRIKVACAMRGEKMSEVLRKVFEREFPRS